MILPAASSPLYKALLSFSLSREAVLRSRARAWSWDGVQFRRLLSVLATLSKSGQVYVRLKRITEAIFRGVAEVEHSPWICVPQTKPQTQGISHRMCYFYGTPAGILLSVSPSTLSNSDCRCQILMWRLKGHHGRKLWMCSSCWALYSIFIELESSMNIFMLYKQ